MMVWAPPLGGRPKDVRELMMMQLKKAGEQEWKIECPTARRDMGRVCGPERMQSNGFV